jgi:hypothetical protein
MDSHVARAQERRNDQQIRPAIDAACHGARLLPPQLGQQHVTVALRRQAGIGGTLPMPDEPGGYGRHSFTHSCGST